MKREQRLDRERDPRVRRSLCAGAACAILLMGAGLGVVGLRVQQVHLSYQLDRLRAERGRTESRIRELEIEIATLRSPRRLESTARQIGMTTPSAQQVRLAREYVAGSSGLAAASAARVEARVMAADADAQ